MVGIKAPLALDSFLSGLPVIDSNKGNRFGVDINFTCSHGGVCLVVDRSIQWLDDAYQSQPIDGIQFKIPSHIPGPRTPKTA